MRYATIAFLLTALCSHALPAAALSDAPLRVLTSYIEGNVHCSEQISEWNRKNGRRAVSGELSRHFFYRVLGFLDWGECGRPYFKPIFIELQKAWTIYAKGLVSAQEYEAKESELINLLFAALRSDDGSVLVQRYEQHITARLMRLEPERQYFNCTYFGNDPKCTD
ncbi:MAG: hypothetical protein CVU34_20430 [Betaproteobacteria bacterium HGW-Betaproteobacteria-7]|jgi:hypothetical protein|nr:MAG: hypothetical protein CVU34_20430 [Betaproteobacteria bacterium HGW-Betaproteobacteria-7]